MIDLFGNTEEDLLNDYFLYWRKKGYPHYNSNEYDKQKELLSLILFDENTIFKNKTIKQTMHCLGFIWTYFPNWIDVQYGNQKTIRDLWNDDIELKKLIYKTYQWEKKFGNGYITVNRLRQNSKVYLSKQSVSNFRPTAAKFIYNKYGNKGVVWDMSSGWGGRLFGFLSSDCKKYIGTEPSKNTFEGLTKLKNDFSLKEIELLNYGSEFYIPEPNSLDLCFTSPPYFDTEKYSDDDNQSYLKYPSKDLWLNDFYKRTLQNCYNGLKINSHLIINIANTPKHKWLESETLKICDDLGFKYIDTLNLELSSISGNGAKYEPIFIFQKL
jgi:hypothetical protein